MLYSGTKAPGLRDNDAFYEDFDMDEVDLNIENYEELFGVALNDPEHLFGNEGIGSLFGGKDMSSAALNCQRTYAAEVHVLPSISLHYPFQSFHRWPLYILLSFVALFHFEHLSLIALA